MKNYGVDLTRREARALGTVAYAACTALLSAGAFMAGRVVEEGNYRALDAKEEMQTYSIHPVRLQKPAEISTARERTYPHSTDGIGRWPQTYTRKDLESLVGDAAKDYGVSPALLRAIADTESSWNPGATSNKGAQGLLQLMPVTVRSINRGEHGNCGYVDDPYDPMDNAKGGACYLKSLIRMFGGDEDLAIAGWNDGPYDTQKRLNQHGSKTGALQNSPQETKMFFTRVKSVKMRYPNY